MKNRHPRKTATPWMMGLLGSALLGCGGATTTTTTGTPPALLAASIAADQCTAWSASAVYTAGQCVVHEGKVYRAKWWVQGAAPGGDPWGA